MDENKDIVEIYTLQDEEGKEHEFQLLATCEKNGTTYYAMVPAEGEAEDESKYFEYVVLKKVVENGEENLITIDDDEEFDSVADYFDDILAEEIDYDEKDGPSGKKN